MNLPPISSTFASSLAGSVKASTDKSSADASQTQTVQHQAAELQVDGVIKSTASNDGEADGRQLLDTFERHSQDKDEAEPASESLDTTAMGTVSSNDDNQQPRPTLDLQA